MVFISEIGYYGQLQAKGSVRMKIKCVRFPCEVCSKLASIQVFFNKSGTAKYSRARHYSGILNGKPQFEYHQQSLQYIERKLSELPKGEAEIGHIGQHISIDLKQPALSPKLSSMAGGEGFEPSTPNLGGWCSIRTELLAHSTNSDGNLDIKTLLKIEKLLIHLLTGTNSEWIVEGTTDKNRAMQLIAQDFLYVNTTPDGTMIYKKAK